MTTDLRDIQEKIDFLKNGKRGGSDDKDNRPLESIKIEIKNKKRENAPPTTTREVRRRWWLAAKGCCGQRYGF